MKLHECSVPRLAECRRDNQRSKQDIRLFGGLPEGSDKIFPCCQPFMWQDDILLVVRFVVEGLNVLEAAA